MVSNMEIMPVHSKMKNYAPKGKVVWDSWFIKEKGEYHVFYLQADPLKRSGDLEYPTSVGHSVSKDLVDWKEIGTVLEPNEKGWDDAAIWTGSVVKKGKKFYMFYTGRTKKELMVQRIGAAVSDNLIDWEKFSENPVLVADKKYYQMENKRNKLGKVGAWRDPFVFEDKGKYFMTISARKNGKKKENNACVAIAESDDLTNWKVKKPILFGRGFDEMEVTQIVKYEGRYYLFFSSHERGDGLFCYHSDKLFGEYKPVNKDGFVVGEGIYGVRLVDGKDGVFRCIGWVKDRKLSMPFNIRIDGDKVCMC